MLVGISTGSDAWLPANVRGLTPFCKQARVNRIATVILYLNDVEKGGETTFLPVTPEVKQS